MPCASAGVRELGFGASSAGAVPGFGEARPRAGGRGRCCSGEATRRHYVFADSSGAVVIPDVQIHEVLAAARKVEAADAAVRDQIAREQIRTNRRVPIPAGLELNIGGKTTP